MEDSYRCESSRYKVGNCGPIEKGVDDSTFMIRLYPLASRRVIAFQRDGPDRISLRPLCLVLIK